ncbi:MAG TPA: alpha/beta fold hydrolase [Burkholderiales bacterium]|nr:alpha/beta fold hydrolase [Burkholderiales bacterium]
MKKARDVVLLHGWGCTASVWNDLAERLAPRLRVHVPELPGYGAAPACAPYTLEALAGAVARAAPRRCHVVGWSLGGEVALAWARRAPHQVRRLALIATTPCFAGRPGWPCATAPAVLREFGRLLAADRAGTVARLIAEQARGDARARRVATVLQQFSASGATDGVLAAGLAVLRDADLRGELRKIAQPALVLHGARDRIVPPAAGRGLAAALPNARFSLLRACAHAPFLSQPGQVARALQEFFDE